MGKMWYYRGNLRKREVPPLKKFWILLIAVLLLFTLAGTATAVETRTSEQTEEVIFEPNEDLVKEAEQLYKTCLSRFRKVTGKTTFGGYCGQMTSYQLYELDINTNLDIFNGKDQYDNYAKLEQTKKGHTVRAYSAKEYSMEEALNAVCANGKKTVRNILVGFQRTDTDAGKKYGHCLVINAIEGGMIYYTESFTVKFSDAKKVQEGKTIVCSIAEFADYYNSWMTYEGLVYFGEPEYANKCVSYKTDVYVQVRFDSTLRSQPCLLEENGCQSLRTLEGGEFLHVTGLFKSEAGDLFYRVVNGDTVGYISANAVYLLQPEEMSATLSSKKIPTELTSGKKLSVSGVVEAANANISALTLEVKDKDGAVCLSVTAAATDNKWDLSLLNQTLKKTTIADGSYCLTVSVTLVSVVAEYGEIVEISTQQELCCQVLTVGKGESLTLSGDNTVRNGWFEKDGVWYCYKGGAPVSGWIIRVGVKYYLNADGSMTTGWAEIDGVTRYFSPTGAMCLGWITTYEGVHYLYDDGTLATGLHTIDGVTYYFDKDGVLQTWGTVMQDGRQYTIDANGIATKIA